MPTHLNDLFIFSPLRGTLLVLATVLILAVLRFRRRYLSGQTYRQQFDRGVAGMAAGVAVILITQHLALMAVGWVVTNLALQQLLRLNAERPRAVLAAHKQLLGSRLGELLLAGAFLLLYLDHGSWFLNEILAPGSLATASSLTTLSVLLLVVVALLQCAQLPAHGWLMQVMEAPTPVSALLHAGIINLGGILLLLLSPLLDAVQSAQWLLLVAAGLTVITASLAMSGQAAIKTRLAWSSSAQMGLLLMECALGLYELALLHLVAHSVYKANAFLNAGQLVQPISPAQRRSEGSLVAGALPAILATAAVGFVVSGTDVIVAPWVLIALTASGVALTVSAQSRGFSWLKGTMVSVAFVLVYAVLKSLVDTLVIPGASRASMLQDAFALAVFCALGAIAWRLGNTDRTRHTWSDGFAHGFWLDAWFTRLALTLWPIRWPAGSIPPFPSPRTPSEVQI